MKTKRLRIKITLRLGILLILGGAFLNLAVKNIIDINGTNVIKNDMKMQQNNSTEFINQYFIIKNKTLDEGNFISNSPNIAIKLCDYSNATIGIYDVNGKLQYESSKDKIDKNIDTHIKKAKENRASIFFSNREDDYKGYFAYPLYSGDKFIGIIEIIKDYKEIITNNRNIYFLFTIVEIIFLLGILLSINFIVRKSTKPIENLLKGVKEISKGNYGYEVVEGKNKDEIRELAFEYNNMRKKIKEQIEVTHKLEKNRRDFFCNITHELKTPLTSISGYAELLQTNYDNEKFRNQAIDSIIKESNKLNSMISSILEVSKGQILNKEKSEFDIGILLKQISEEMKIRNNNIDTKLDISKYNIIAIYDEIKSLIINLLENAYKYSIHDASIEIKGYRDEDFYSIDIVNESYDMDDKFKEKAFEPFARGKNSKALDGNGLGLYICKLIVEEHSGHISIDVTGNVVKVNVKLKSM